jgi:hypothetical protein
VGHRRPSAGRGRVGLKTHPSLATLKTLAKALRVPVTELLE